MSDPATNSTAEPERGAPGSIHRMVRCPTCGKNPSFGDCETCSQIVMEELNSAGEAAARYVEKMHFERTGERKTFSQLFQDMFKPKAPNNTLCDTGNKE